MLDEHQDIESFQQHGAHVQEVNRKDPAGLGMQKLPPRRARAAWRWIDSRGVQDLPHGGRRDRHAGFRQVAVDATVSPQRIFLRQAGDQAGDAGGPPAAGRACAGCSCRIFSLPVFCARPAASLAGRGKMSVQRLRGMSRASAVNQTRLAGSYRTRVAWRRSTAFSCRSISSSASFALPAEHQDSEAEYPAN